MSGKMDVSDGKVFVGCEGPNSKYAKLSSDDAQEIVIKPVDDAIASHTIDDTSNGPGIMSVEADISDRKVFGGCEGPNSKYVKLSSGDGQEIVIEPIEDAIASHTIDDMLSGPVLGTVSKEIDLSDGKVFGGCKGHNSKCVMLSSDNGQEIVIKPVEDAIASHTIGAVLSGTGKISEIMDVSDGKVFGGCEGPNLNYVMLSSEDGQEIVIKAAEHAIASHTIDDTSSGSGTMSEETDTGISDGEVFEGCEGPNSKYAKLSSGDDLEIVIEPVEDAIASHTIDDTLSGPGAMSEEVDVSDGKVFGGCEEPNSMYMKVFSADGQEFIVKREHLIESRTIDATSTGPGAMPAETVVSDRNVFERWNGPDSTDVKIILPKGDVLYADSGDESTAIVLRSLVHQGKLLCTLTIVKPEIQQQDDQMVAGRSSEMRQKSCRWQPTNALMQLNSMKPNLFYRFNYTLKERIWTCCVEIDGIEYSGTDIRKQLAKHRVAEAYFKWLYPADEIPRWDPMKKRRMITDSDRNNPIAWVKKIQPGNKFTVKENFDVAFPGQIFTARMEYHGTFYEGSGPTKRAAVLAAASHFLSMYNSTNVSLVPANAGTPADQQASCCCICC